MTPKGQSARDSRLRREGYDDGYAARPCKRLDAEYQRAWRRGRDARRKVYRKAFVDAPPQRGEAS